MEIQLLKDPDILPTKEVLEKVLGNEYLVFREFMNTAESEELKLKPEWRYYKDGKAWLCKITFRKKTVVWLSVWSDCFKLGLYFTEKSGKGIPELKIDDSIKEFYLNHKPIGKLKPIVVEVRSKSQLVDIITLIKYKIGQL
jgi:Protein of unknown function (DUF3788)